MAWVAGWLLIACGGPGSSSRTGSAQPSIDGSEPEQATDSSQITENIDLMTMQELRLLRSSVYARAGMLFNESDLRRYWRENTAWYDTLSRSHYAEQFAGELTPDGQALVDRIDNRMAQLQTENYIRTGYDTTANILNIVNIFQFGEINRQEVMDGLAVDNYAMVPDTLLQLFQVYQRNDSLQIPNFVTADLMAQLSHVYEAYVLRTVEEKHLAPMLAELCLALYGASVDQAGKAAREDVKDMAAFNAAFFAVPYNLLTGKSLKIPGDYQATAEEELAYIAQQENHRPALLEIKTDFDYGAFKPYGHYTRTAGLRRYFKAWKWLQLAPYCSDSKTRLQRAVLVAAALQTAKTKSGVSAVEIYSRLSGAMDWFAGLPAGSSVLDVALLLKKERATSITAALDTKLLAKVSAMIDKATAGNAPVRYPAVCRNGIYFLPQPAYADEEVLQATADPAPDAKRPFPKVLDVLAAFGSKPAFDKLFLDNREDTVWTAYPEQMAKMTERMRHFKDWNTSSYNKRLECMLAMQQKPLNSPVFAQKQAWNRKKLETSSALWVKMKHDVLLYGSIPDHPEPLDTASLADSLPEPLTAGYVEPALPFWTRLREWVELTDRTLEKYRLTTDTLTACSARLYRYIALMEDAARRELNNERLPDETCRFIAHIGDSIRQFTLAMIEPKIDRWEWTAGTDRSAAVFEKVFRRDIAGSPSNGALYAATGNICNIYAVVEIDGYLYLTKGAAFSYDEFSMPKGKDLKDEDWQEMRRKIHRLIGE
jgi:hypothetical protein